MNQLDKLRVLIPHWIDHNNEHAKEFHHWAKEAGEAGPEVLAAEQAMTQVNQALTAALEKLGGAISFDAIHERDDR